MVCYFNRYDTMLNNCIWTSGHDHVYKRTTSWCWFVNKLCYLVCFTCIYKVLWYGFPIVCPIYQTNLSSVFDVCIYLPLSFYVCSEILQSHKFHQILQELVLAYVQMSHFLLQKEHNHHLFLPLFMRSALNISFPSILKLLVSMFSVSFVLLIPITSKLLILNEIP